VPLSPLYFCNTLLSYPLLTIAMEGNIRLLRFLLNGGADIETRSDMGNTAMLYAPRRLPSPFATLFTPSPSIFL